MKATVETTAPVTHASLYDCRFGSYVEILSAPPEMAEYVGRICAWTPTNDLVPLEEPKNARHVPPDDTHKILVRKLSVGEKVTLTIKGE